MVIWTLKIWSFGRQKVWSFGCQKVWPFRRQKVWSFGCQKIWTSKATSFRLRKLGHEDVRSCALNVPDTSSTPKIRRRIGNYGRPHDVLRLLGLLTKVVVNKRSSLRKGHC